MYIAYFIRLIPLQSKYETKTQFKARIIEYKKNLVSSFTDKQIELMDMGKLLLITSTVIWINHYYTHYSDGIIISIFFTVSALISSYENKNDNKTLSN
jgi:hypothetical protein